MSTGLAEPNIDELLLAGAGAGPDCSMGLVRFSSTSFLRSRGGSERSELVSLSNPNFETSED